MERSKRSIKIFDVAFNALYLDLRQKFDNILIALTGRCFATRNVEYFRPEVSIPVGPVSSVE